MHKTMGTGDTTDTTSGQRDEKKQAAGTMTKMEIAGISEAFGECPNNSGETRKKEHLGRIETVSGRGKGGMGAQDAKCQLQRDWKI